MELTVTFRRRGKLSGEVRNLPGGLRMFWRVPDFPGCPRDFSRARAIFPAGSGSFSETPGTFRRPRGTFRETRNFPKALGNLTEYRHPSGGPGTFPRHASIFPEARETFPRHPQSFRRSPNFWEGAGMLQGGAAGIFGEARNLTGGRKFFGRRSQTPEGSEKFSGLPIASPDRGGFRKERSGC